MGKVDATSIGIAEAHNQQWCWKCVMWHYSTDYNQQCTLASLVCKKLGTEKLSEHLIGSSRDKGLCDVFVCFFMTMWTCGWDLAQKALPAYTKVQLMQSAIKLGGLSLHSLIPWICFHGNWRVECSVMESVTLWRSRMFAHTMILIKILHNHPVCLVMIRTVHP